MYYMNITFLLQVFQTGGKNDIERAQRAHARQGGVVLWHAPGEIAHGKRASSHQGVHSFQG